MTSDSQSTLGSDLLITRLWRKQSNKAMSESLASAFNGWRHRQENHFLSLLIVKLSFLLELSSSSPSVLGYDRRKRCVRRNVEQMPSKCQEESRRLWQKSLSCDGGMTISDGGTLHLDLRHEESSRDQHRAYPLIQSRVHVQANTRRGPGVKAADAADRDSRCVLELVSE